MGRCRRRCRRRRRRRPPSAAVVAVAVVVVLCGCPPNPPKPRIPPPSPSNPLRVVGGLPRHYTGHLVIGCDASPPRPPPSVLSPPSRRRWAVVVTTFTSNNYYHPHIDMSTPPFFLPPHPNLHYRHVHSYRHFQHTNHNMALEPGKSSILRYV